MELIRHKTKKPNRGITNTIKNRLFSLTGPDKLELLAVAAYLDAQGFRKNRVNGAPVRLRLWIKAENIATVWAIHYKTPVSIKPHITELRIERLIADYRRETGTDNARHSARFIKSKPQQSPTGTETN